MESNLEQQLLSLLLLGFFASLVNGLCWRKGFFHLPRQQPSPEQLLPLSTVFGAFSVYLVTQMIIVPLFSLGIIRVATGEIPDLQAIDTVTRSAIQLATMVLSCVLVWIYLGVLPNPLRKNLIRKGTAGWKSRSWDVIAGIVALICAYPVVIWLGEAVETVIQFFFTVESSEQVAVQYFKMTVPHPLLLLGTTFAIAVLVPAVEELLFRGFLQTWIRQKLGVLPAIAVSSVVFAAFHYAESQGAKNFELLPALFVLSCFLGFVYERQQALLAPVALHVTFNAVSLGLLTFGKG